MSFFFLFVPIHKRCSLVFGEKKYFFLEANKEKETFVKYEIS